MVRVISWMTESIDDGNKTDLQLRSVLMMYASLRHPPHNLRLHYVNYSFTSQT